MKTDNTIYDEQDTETITQDVQADPPNGFHELGLNKNLIRALAETGYENPTPIQRLTIPKILAGRDVVGQAQTGTGKTAAFALPLLANTDLDRREIQVLVLTPTRELAIQVSEAFQRYAAFLDGFHIVPIYGGQEYSGQLRRLGRGVQVVVGTPGRVMDHMRRGTLRLDALKSLVLDEADEMLRMGFIDDVEWILEQTPAGRQVALFSATMPQAIRRIAKKYLNQAEELTVKSRTSTVKATRQRYWEVNGVHKLDALTRILEAETFDAVLIFVRTKTGTLELSEKLAARGYACAPLNGDIAQSRRERTIEQLKSAQLNILVATDVAARGLDVDRISHVINYDIPSDTESYVHRIGRTGRAGRSGQAILFVAPREMRMLRSIEKATHQKIESMQLPSTDDINDRRIARFKQRITDTLAAKDLSFFANLVKEYSQEYDIPADDIAAALAALLQGDEPLLLKHIRHRTNTRAEKPGRERKQRAGGRKKHRQRNELMTSYRIEVGHHHRALPGNIVGAIANETGISGREIGQIRIFDDHSTVDLPSDLPAHTIKKLKKVWVGNTQLQISEHDGRAESQHPGRNRKERRRHLQKSRK